MHEAKGAEYQSYWETASRFLENYGVYKKRIADKRPIPIMVLQRIKP